MITDLFISADTETTGLDPKTARVCELGLAVFEHGKPVRTVRRLVHPGVPIPAEASKVHHITDADVATAPPLGAWPRFEALLRSQRLIGYNLLDYDGPVLTAEGERHLGRTYAVGGVDAFVFVRWSLRHLRSRRLERVAQHLGVRLDHAHSAAADALATGEVLVRLIEQGLIPPDRLGALRRQGELVPQLHDEFARWTYHIYRDREDGKTLRLGYGKHCGRPLEEARGFVAWALDQHEQGLLLGGQDRNPLPEEVYREFRRHVPPGSPLARRRTASTHRGSGFDPRAVHPEPLSPKGDSP